MNDNPLNNEKRKLGAKDYKYGFVTDIESQRTEKALSEEIVGQISELKKEPSWLREWRVDT